MEVGKTPVEIRAEDLEITLYRAPNVNSGAMTTGEADRAVKVKHIPTGLTAICGTERSQLMNKAICLVMLQAGLA